MNESYSDVPQRRKCNYEKGDILRHADRPDNPLEVFCACELPHRDWVLFVMDKRTLLGAFVYDDDAALTLVRRPDRCTVAASAGKARDGKGCAGKVRPRYG